MVTVSGLRWISKTRKERIVMEGILIGIATFILIGLFHPIVIKAEYYYGTRVNIWFFLGGIVFAILSLIVNNLIGSILLGVTSCCSLWSIKEIKEQEERVLKGWFPMNPKRKDYYEKKMEEFSEKN